MKKSYFSPLASVLFMALVGLSACQKNDSGGGGGGDTGVTATTPCTTDNMATCNPGAYNQYANSQVQFSNYQGGYANGFCGCPSGSRPIMNPTLGLSCAPANFFQPYQYGYGNSGNQYGYANQHSYGSGSGYRAWGYAYFCIGANSYNDPRCGGQYNGNNGSTGNISQYPGQNNQWSSIPQVTYSPALSGTQNNCYSQAAATCDLRQANPCGNNGVCRPTGGGTYLGICSYGRGVEGYGQSSPCIIRQNNGGYINVCGYNGYSYGNGQNTTTNSQLPIR